MSCNFGGRTIDRSFFALSLRAFAKVLRISVAVLCVYFHFGSSKLMACVPCEIDNGCELLSELNLQPAQSKTVTRSTS